MDRKPPRGTASKDGPDGRAAPSHVTASQDEVFRFLEDPATHGLPGKVTRIDTHGAAVFLAGADAWKVKRAVRFPFMDFSTLDKRGAACEAEIAVNRRDAPDIYLGAVPIVRRDGALHLGGAGETVEWAVHMRRFDERLTLDHVAGRGELTPGLVARTADAVAAAHARAPRRARVDFAAALGALIDENGESLGETPELFDPAAIARLTGAARAALSRVAGLLESRAAAGDVRRCHGDLHLRNLVLLEGRPTLFDAIEFDEALATTDVLYDLAFLLMDVAERGLRFEACLLLNRYLVACREERHLSGLAAMPLFLSVRAAIRAKVTAFGLPHAGPDRREEAEAEARRYFDFAGAALAPSTPRLLAVGGFSGTGKSTLAARLAADLAPVPGAIHLRSDVERKQLSGAGEFERLPAAAYDRATTREVYERLHRKAAMALDAGYSVIVDAVHRRAEERESLARLAEGRGVAFTGLWLEAPVDLLVERVGGRVEDASDADAAVVAMQAERGAGTIDWQRIDASDTAGDVLARARALLAGA